MPELEEETLHGKLGRYLRGGTDAFNTVARNALLQPVAGLAGAGRGFADLVRGKGVDASLASTVGEIDRVQAKAGGPETPEGEAILGGLGDAVDWAMTYPSKGVDWVGEKSPLAGAALAGLGAVVDPSKVGKTLRAAKTAAKVAKGIPEAKKVAGALREGAAAEEVIPKELKGFGTAKSEREAATLKLLEEQADAAPVERQRGQGAKGKQDGRVMRQMYEGAPSPEEGLKQVLSHARRGKHLKPTATGGWVGAPRTVQTEADLKGMRRSLDDQFTSGVTALKFADPQRTATWYNRAKAAHAHMNEPHQLDRGLEGTAAYSAGVDPVSETGFNLKHQNSRAIGEAVRAYRGDAMRTLDEAVTEDRKAELANKVGEYRSKNDPRVEETSPFGVNDFRMGQGFGYTDPAGNPWTGGVSDTMHPFMDAETALAGHRANTRKIAGKSDWTGATMQEIPWVLNKAEDIYSRGKNERFAGGVSGMVKALREANNTAADVLPKHTSAGTYEYVTGADVGHIPQTQKMSMEGKREYGKPGAWDTEGPMVGMDWHGLDPDHPNQGGSPYGTIKANTVGTGKRDALLRAQGIRTLPTKEAIGQYENRAGEIENNPVHLARGLVDFQTVPEGSDIAANTINPQTMKVLKATEMMRGAVDAQEAVAMNLPVTGKSRKGKTSLLLERDSTPSAEELKGISGRIAGLLRQDELARDLGPQKPQYDPYMSVTPTDRGALILNKGKGLSQRHIDELAGGMPGATPRKADFEGLYEQAMTPAGEGGQGTTTSRVLNAWADAPQEAAMNAGESEEVRRLIREKTERDRVIGGGRLDIQNMRNFLAEADWPKAVAMIRKGMTPAAAVAALGYSLQGMAAEKEQ